MNKETLSIHQVEDKRSKDPLHEDNFPFICNKKVKLN